jgi:magnesium transporter
MLINCIAYQNGRKVADLPITDIHKYVGQPDCFVWVALKDATEQELEKMQEEFNLHELAFEDARQGHQRPKVGEYGSSVFAVFHLIEVVDNELHVGEIDVFVGRGYILSIRNRSKQNFVGVRDRCEQEPELLQQGPAFVLYALLDAVVDRYFPIIDVLEGELETTEENILAKGAARSSVEKLYALKARVTIMKHAVQPLMEAVGKLYGGRVPAVCANTQEYCRDVYDHLVRMNASIDAIREAITIAIQVNLSMVTIEDSEIMKRLAAWAGVLGTGIVLAVAWQIFHVVIPGADSKWGYAAALAVIVVICLALRVRFRNLRWM